MINVWFLVGLVIGISARLYDSKIVSISLGVVIAIILFELVKLSVWVIQRT